MNSVNKFGKIALMVSLLFSSVSCVQAMQNDLTPEEWQAIARNQQVIDAEQHAREAEKNNQFVPSTPLNNPFLTWDATSLNNPFIHPAPVSNPFIPANSDLTPEDWIAIGLGQRAINAEQNNRFNDITAQEWEIIKNQEIEAQKASATIWTRDPGREVPVGHPQYRLRADNIPLAQINGQHHNVPAMGLGKFIHSLENRVNKENGVEEWEIANVKREEQRQQRAQVSHTFLDAEKERRDALLQAEKQRSAQEENARLEAIRKLEAQKQQLPQEKKPDPSNLDVSSLAAQFGGQGGYKRR